MVANHCDSTGIHDSLNTGSRFRAVPDYVAEAKGASNREGLDVGKHGIECVDIRVDVTDDGEEGV